MNSTPFQHVMVHLSGQDDNLGDSVLRASLLRALRGRNRRFHIYVGNQSSDYVAGLQLDEHDVLHPKRADWLAAGGGVAKPIHVFNAGEINPVSGRYPNKKRAAELRAVRRSGGAVIAAGIGIKTPSEVTEATFEPALRDADLVSWRDAGSREAAGFGTVQPDWAFALGTPTHEWPGRDMRPLLTVTLRFDRPYPDAIWLDTVRSIAQRTETRIVTVAQVSRDAPRAVRLAAELGGEYLISPSFNHVELETHIRSVYQSSLAVISDRAHGLIIGATEGAIPIGSAADPQKIVRLLSTAGLGCLVGKYGDLSDFGDQVDAQLPVLAPAIDETRNRLDELTLRIQALIGSLEPL